MNEYRLNYLSILNIECDGLDDILYENIISDFLRRNPEKTLINQ